MKTPEIYVGQKIYASGVLHFIVFTVVDNTIMNPCTLNICLFLLQLLAPHLRYTLEINCRGRTQLISANGIFKRVCHSETVHLIGIFKLN